MAKYTGLVGDVKSSRLVEQKIQQIILSNASPDSDTSGYNLLAELAEYLRSVFGADVCLLYTQPQENAVVAIGMTTIVGIDMVTGGATQENCSLHNRSTLIPLLELVQLPERQVMNLGEISNLEELEGTELLPSLQSLGSILFLRTSAEGLVLLGRNQGISSEHRPWTKGQKDLLMAVANLLAIALALRSNIDLALSRNIALRRTHEQLAISYPYQKLTNQITQAIRDHQEINQILKQAIIATSETLQANAGLVLLLKYKDLAWKRAEANSLAMIQVTTAAHWAIPGYEPQLFPLQSAFGVSTSPLCCQALQQSPQPLIIHGNSILVMFPLMGASGKSLSARVLGFLVLEYSPTRQLLPGELELISSVSNQMSYALIQDQTLRQVKAIVDERTAQLQVSLEVQGRLYEKIRHQVDQLRQLNQIKDEFISAISHELRTPLTSMTLAIRMLQEEELSPERRAKYLEVLAQQCQQEILLINDLLALQQLEENSPLISLEMTNIQPILQQLRLTFQQHWTTKALKLKLEVLTENPATDNVASLSNIGSEDNIISRDNIILLDKLGFADSLSLLSNTSPISNTTFLDDTAYLDSINSSANIHENSDINNRGNIKSTASLGDRREEPDWESLSLLPDMYISTHADTLQRILAELLTNAGKYSHSDTTVVLRVEKTTAEISFKVTNEGEGIPPEEQELIFEKFYRAQTSVRKAIPGTGLGLALVKPLVKHLRGEITVVSSPNPKAGTDKSTSDKPQGWITCFAVKLPQFLDGGTV